MGSEREAVTVEGVETLGRGGIGEAAEIEEDGCSFLFSSCSFPNNFFL